MRIVPGLDQLTERLPEIATVQGFPRALAMALVPFGIALAILTILDAQGQRFAALAAQVAMYVGAHFLLRRFFQPGRMAYADGFFNHFLPAAGLHMASLAFILLVTQAPTRFVPNIGIVVALYLALTGLALIARAVGSAGADTLAGLYVYFPDEGRHVTGSVYDVLRHPVYAGLARLAWGFALWNGSLFAVLLATLFSLVYLPHWIAVEEEELTERLGPDYTAFAATRPAVYPDSPATELEILRAVVRRGDAPAKAAAISD